MPSYKITLSAEVEGIKTHELAEQIAEVALKGLPAAVLGNRVKLLKPEVVKVEIIKNVDEPIYGD